MFDNYPPYLSVSEVCEILSIEKHTVYQLIAEQKLKAIRVNDKLWKISRNDLAYYVLNESGIPVEMEDIDDYI